MSESEDTIARVSALFIQMGASAHQAEVMASQLLKRAGQIAAERDISFLEAAESLLKTVVEARRSDGSGLNADLR